MTAAAGPAPPPGAARPDLPPDLHGWNWGGFLLTWVWGIGNSTYLSFLVFVPVVGMFTMPFVLGVKGNAWAWRNGTWTGVAHFQRVQRRWAIGGVAVWAALIVLGALLFFGVQGILTGSEPYRLGLEAIAADARLADRLGRPISGGTAQGSIETSGEGGTAALDFPVTGPKGAGRATLAARKTSGAWTVTSLRVKIDGDPEPVDVVPSGPGDRAEAGPPRPGG